MLKGIALFILLLSLGGCDFERRTEVRVEGVPPSFILRGSGDLNSVIVYDVNNVVIWHFQAEDHHGEPVAEIRQFKYGVVPGKYRQIMPEKGQVPPPLKEGERYAIHFTTGDAPGAAIFFEIVNGRLVYAPIES